MSEDISKLSKKELLQRLKEKEEHEKQLESIGAGGGNVELDKLDHLVDETHPYKLEVSMKEDPKSVMLYTAINKRVGPMHPVNARRVMIRWKKAGIQLYTTKRTEAQVKAFKESDEYKTYHAKHLEGRRVRHEASGKGKVENIARDIARETAKLTQAQAAAA